jgi:hypothetical protein
VEISARTHQGVGGKTQGKSAEHLKELYRETGNTVEELVEEGRFIP